MHNSLLAMIKEYEVTPGSIGYWWLGQMGWCVKTAQHTLYIDPYLSDREKRTSKPVLNPAEIDNADIIICTHDHIDHIDHPILPVILQASASASLVVPEVAVEELVNGDGIARERILPLRAGASIEAAGCRLTAIKAKHETFDYTEEYGFPYLQYIVEVDGVVLYHAGDTLLYDGMLSDLQRWSIDIAFVPINGRDAVRYRRNCMGCMTWQEAVDLCGELKPRLVCPGHWDMFPDNSENPFLFLDYLRTKYPEVACWIGMPGDMGCL